MKSGSWELLKVDSEPSGMNFVRSELLEAAPMTPKCIAVGDNYKRLQRRYARARGWISIVDVALVAAIRQSFETDKRRGPSHSQKVINFMINGRDYVMLRKRSFRHGPPIELEVLAFPDEDDTSFQQVDMTVSSPRPNVIRSGRSYSPEEIFRLPNKATFLDGDKVSFSGKRLRMFKDKGVACVTCGLVGTRFYKEKENRDAKFWTLNLYAVGKNGNEVLMTRDHIMPLARGGSDKIENSQPMCTKCNNRKGDSVETKPGDQADVQSQA